MNPGFFNPSQEETPDSYHKSLGDFGVQAHSTDLFDSGIPCVMIQVARWMCSASPDPEDLVDL